jgi:hypothetical protein
MRGFLGKSLQQQSLWKEKEKESGVSSSIHLANANYTINTIQVYGQEKYLVVCILCLSAVCLSVCWSDSQTNSLLLDVSAFLKLASLLRNRCAK